MYEHQTLSMVRQLKDYQPLIARNTDASGRSFRWVREAVPVNDEHRI